MICELNERTSKIATIKQLSAFISKHFSPCWFVRCPCFHSHFSFSFSSFSFFLFFSFLKFPFLSLPYLPFLLFIIFFPLLTFPYNRILSIHFIFVSLFPSFSWLYATDATTSTDSSLRLRGQLGENVRKDQYRVGEWEKIANQQQKKVIVNRLAG